MIDLSIINPLAVLVATIAGAFLGALWYSPAMFLNTWLAALGKTRDEIGSPAKSMIGSVISCAVAAFSVALLVAATGATTMLAGAGLGMLLAVGIVAMTMLSDYLFSGWSWTHYFIQVGYRATYLVIMGAICGAWTT